jgi:hypothetical protein
MRSLIFLIAPTVLVGASDWRLVTNQRQHYVISLPRTWKVWDIAENGTLYASTYTHSYEGGLVPRGEAAISISVDRTVTGRTAWADQDSFRVEELSRKTVTVSDRRSSITSYLYVDSRDQVGPGVYYRMITLYTSLPGRLLRVRIEFADTDPRESLYRETIERIVQSVRAIR